MRRSAFMLTITVVLILLLFAVSACSREQGATSTEMVPEDITEASQTQADAEASKTQVDNEASQTQADDASSDNKSQENQEEEYTMKLKINDTQVNVAWENNESVKALAKLAENGPVTIETEPFGGFEQVGSIGATLPSSDTSIKTKAGDIMLYTSDHIVIFYGSNSWAYTRLGKITDKSKSELQDLLGGYGVTVTITAE